MRNLLLPVSSASTSEIFVFYISQTEMKCSNSQIFVCKFSQNRALGLSEEMEKLVLCTIKIFYLVVH